MEECPFLSTYDEYVECFKECAFYDCADNGGECPFKQSIDKKSEMLNKVYEALELKNKYNLEYILQATK